MSTNKTAPKRNKKEEQKKMMVRVACIVLAVAMVLTSGIAMASWLFQDDTHTAVGIDEHGNIVDEHGHILGTVTMTEDGEGEAGHYHEDGTFHAD